MASDVNADNRDNDRYNYKMRAMQVVFIILGRDMMSVRGDIVEINIRMGLKMIITITDRHNLQ